ncbi:MAG: asparagine synthase (glutamine-hydrolyzing) [bacterium]
MCGIAGAISLGRPIDEADRVTAAAMTHVLRHRGPDRTGFFADASCVLGNTRLKILDLSDAANLPMSSPDGRVHVVYNGEVTNFRELRARLRLDERHAFRTTSDTEVVLALYLALGIDFLRELTGMFALCIYDQRAQKVYVVRDFFGIRPLFVMATAERLYFASEIKSFLEIPGFSGRIDEEAFFHFFGLAYIPGARTPFADVREIDGGHLVEVDLVERRFADREYYALRYAPDASLTEAELAPRLFAAMRDSVARNLVSDAPLGLTLSGGFDTSSILAITRELVGDRDIHTYSIAMADESFDESAYQRIMVDATRSIHHEIRFGPELVLEHLIEHMAFLDEPTGDGAAIPSYVLAKEARKTVAVLLSGEGGDEVFNAYETHGAFKVRQLYRRWVPETVRLAARAAARQLPCSYRKLSFDFLAKRFTEGAEHGTPEAHYFWRHALSPDEQRALMPACTHTPPTATLFRELFDRHPFPDELNRISLIDLKYYFIGDLMVKNDRTFMAHSVEARFPWMDRLLFELMSSVPPDLRIHGLERRYIQKQAMKDHVPEAIYRRSNMGLEMPHSAWFLRELRPLGERYFARDAVARVPFLDPDTVRALWDDHLARRKDHGRSLWCILNAIVWFDLFVHTRDYKRYLR